MTLDPKQPEDAGPDRSPEQLFQNLAQSALLAHEASVGLDAKLTLLASEHNHVYRVDTPRSGTYLLRIQPTSSVSDAAANLQLAWLVAIAEATDVVAPRPVPLPDGRLSFNALSGDGVVPAWRCVLLHWVEGDGCVDANTFVTSQVLTAVGEAVGKLHKHARAYKPQGSEGFSASSELVSLRRYDPDEIFGPKSCLGNGLAQAHLSPDEFATLLNASETIRSILQEIGQDPEHFGLIHADLIPQNWVFHNGEARPIDFDEFGLGYFLFDLVSVLWSHATWPDYPHYCETLFAGYERIQPIPHSLKVHADLFQAMAFIGWINHRLRRENTNVERCEFANTYGPLAARMLKSLCRL